MEELYSFKEIKKEDIEKAGVKGAYLAEIYNNNLSVPIGFIISSNAFESFLENNQLKDKINNLLSVIDFNDAEKVQAIANEVQKLIVTTKMSESLKSKITDAYQGLNIKEGEVRDVEKLLESKDVFVAVRSSSTMQDSEEASGLHATFLNVKGVEKLIKSVQICWASLFTARAVTYRGEKEINQLDNSMAVIVQKMVYPRKSGLIFTANPENNNKNELVVEACFGLSDALIAGKIDADSYVLSKESLDIKKEEIREQEFRYVLDDETGKKLKEELGEYGSKQVLEINDVKELARIGKKIESLFEKPMEVEWTLEDKFYILQVKPIIGLEEETTEEIGLETYEEEAPEKPSEEPEVEQVIEPTSERIEVEEITEAQIEEEPIEEKEETTEPVTEEVEVEEITETQIEEEPVEEKEEPMEEKPLETYEALPSEESEEAKEEEKEPITLEDIEPITIEEPEEEAEEELREEKELEEPEVKEELREEKEEIKEEEPEVKEESQEVKEEPKPEPKSDMFEKVIFSAGNTVVACDMAITNALGKRYKEKFEKTPPNNFYRILAEIKTEVEVPLEEDIKKVHELRNTYLKEQKALAGDIKFALDTLEKFLEKF